MKNIWEPPPVVQDETRMMDPDTWHAKKTIGKVYHQHHPYHPYHGLLGWENLLKRRGSCVKGAKVHSCFQIYLHCWHL